MVKVLLPANIPTARVTVDDGEAHPAYLERSLPEGLHELKVSAEGYVSTARTVRVVAGREELWRPVLVRATDPAYRAPPPPPSPGLLVVPFVTLLEAVTAGEGAGGSGGSGSSSGGSEMATGTGTELNLIVSGVEGAEVMLSPPAPGTAAGAWLSLPRTVRWERAVSVRLVVRAPGRVTRSQDVDINPGEKATVSITAESLPRARRWVPWALGAVGVVAVGGALVVISRRGGSDGVL